MTKKKSLFDDLTRPDVVPHILEERQRKIAEIPPEPTTRKRGRKLRESGDPAIDKYINFNSFESNTVVQISPLLRDELELLKVKTRKSIKQLVAEACVKHFNLK